MGAASPATPTAKTQSGRPAVDHRRILNGMLWIVRTGASGQAVPERYDPWRTVVSRFYRWQQAGGLKHLFDTLTP
jgi:transposase